MFGALIPIRDSALIINKVNTVKKSIKEFLVKFGLILLLRGGGLRNLPPRVRVYMPWILLPSILLDCTGRGKIAGFRLEPGDCCPILLFQGPCECDSRQMLGAEPPTLLLSVLGWAMKCPMAEEPEAASLLDLSEVRRPA
jgi:hypothetical protein